MTQIYSHNTGAAALELVSTDDGLSLRVFEVSGHDAVTAISVDVLRALLTAADPQPIATVPDNLSPAGSEIAAHLARGFDALSDLLKVRPGEVDTILRHFVKHVSNWRGHLLTEVAA